jgi:hypothetical protein
MDKMELIHLTPNFDETDENDFYYYVKIIWRFLKSLLHWTSNPSQSEYLSKVQYILEIIAELTDRPDLKKFSSLLNKLEKIFIDLAFISGGGVLLPIRVIVLVEDIQALIEGFKEFSEEFELFKNLFEPVLGDLNEFSTKATSSKNWTCLNFAYHPLMLDGATATSRENLSSLNSTSKSSVGKLDDNDTATKNADFRQNIDKFFQGLGSSIGRDTLKLNACKRDAIKLVQESSNFISSDRAFLRDAWSVT